MRRPNEPPNAFLDRKYCSNSCSMREKQALRYEKQNKEFKICAYQPCSKRFYRKIGVEAITSFSKRKYCSSTCGSRGSALEAKKEKGKRHELDTRCCKNPLCNNPVIRRTYDSPSRYAQRKYCSLSCNAIVNNQKRGQDNATSKKPKSNNANSKKAKVIPSSKKAKSSVSLNDTPKKPGNSIVSERLDTKLTRLELKEAQKKVAAKIAATTKITIADFVPPTKLESLPAIQTLGSLCPICGSTKSEYFQCGVCARTEKNRRNPTQRTGAQR